MAKIRAIRGNMEGQHVSFTAPSYGCDLFDETGMALRDRESEEPESAAATVAPLLNESLRVTALWHSSRSV